MSGSVTGGRAKEVARKMSRRMTADALLSAAVCDPAMATSRVLDVRLSTL